ncbi:MAG: TetR family transcriptional regulator [Sphingobium sp.]
MANFDINPSAGDSLETRDRIKQAARLLFIEHGIDNVSVRQIVAAAGQRHVGAIAYYFSSKDALVEEILAEGAKIIDDLRNAGLDQIEAQGRQPTLHEVVSLIIRSSIAPDVEDGDTFVSFFTVFTLRNRQMFQRVVINRHDAGYKRCIDYIRELLPNVPRTVLNERIVSMMLAIGNSLAAWEAAAGPSEEIDGVIGARALRSPTYLDTLTDFCVGGLSCIPFEQASAG